MKFKKQEIFPMALVGSIQFIILTTIAMFFYAGGTRLDPNNLGYSFFNNFFSDLGRTVAYSGEGNLISTILFIIALIGLGLGFLNFFISIPLYFSNTEEERKFSRIIAFSGKFAALAFLGVVLTPANLFPLFHDVFVVLGFFFVLVISVAMLILVFNSEKFPQTYMIIYIVLILLLIVYAGLFPIIPEIITQEHLFIRATIQKIVVYTLMFSFLIQSYGIWKYLGKEQAR